MERYFVTFYSPGTLFAEATTKRIESWDTDIALKMMRRIKERHGATPYGFKFTTRTRLEDDFDSKVTAHSPMYYVDCEVKTLEEIEAENVGSNRILIGNMKTNGFDKVVMSTTGWAWSQPFNDDDVLLESKPEERAALAGKGA